MECVPGAHQMYTMQDNNSVSAWRTLPHSMSERYLGLEPRGQKIL